jgi:hypothetical protein
MKTECTQEPFGFHPLNQRELRGQLDGGAITSDAEGLQACCCGRSRSGQKSSANSRVALPPIGIRNW